MLCAPSTSVGPIQWCHFSGYAINIVGMKSQRASDFPVGDAPQIAPVVNRSLGNLDTRGKFVDVDERRI
jgi:hypothetical protein